MTNQSTYSVRQIIERYESEEDDFVRELEEMRRTLPNSDTEEVPQDPAPILSVLCSLVDEIGSLRSENRQLKTRLAPSPSRARNMVQRMSAMFDGRTALLPRLRRPAHAEIRTGARERLSTPPRKDCLTASSISTDLSEGRMRAPPLVEPEISDSDMDENVFSEGDTSDYARQTRRDSTRRCDFSLDECTSPSSASSSRDPSEVMTSSRSSFFEVFGFRRRRPSQNSQIPESIPTQKKKKRRMSQGECHFKSNEEIHRPRQAQKPPRPASYYPREDSEESDHVRARKATSFLSVQNGSPSAVPMRTRTADRETRFYHEKQGLTAEIEELKMRNQRLVDQLREKSVQFSKLQVHVNKLEKQLSEMQHRCAHNENVEKMILEERIYRTPLNVIEKIEQRLQGFEGEMQTIRNDSNINAQKALSTASNERNTYHHCLEQLDKLQKENFCLMKSHYMDDNLLDLNLRRKLELLPSYEALFAFANKLVQKIREMRWTLIERNHEMSKAEMDLLTAQSSLLVTHAQVERLRLRNREKVKRPRRPSSYHGEHVRDKMAMSELSFYLPFKLQATRVDNQRKLRRKRSNELSDANFEEEFLALYNTTRGPSFCTSHAPTGRIEYMMRELDRQKPKTFSPVMERADLGKRQEKRPISMAEVEDELRVRRLEDARRHFRTNRENSGDIGIRKPSCRSVMALQTAHELSPNATPLAARKVNVADRMPMRVYDLVGEQPPTSRIRKIERGFSTESACPEKRDEMIKMRNDEHRRQNEEKRHSQVLASRIQRSQPVQISRIRPPSMNSHAKARTFAMPRHEQPNMVKERSSTLNPNETKEILASRIQKPDKRSWLEKIKAMKKS